MAVQVDDFVVWDKQKRSSFPDYVLILPDISIGNVGQLTVDLLLNNLKTEHLGRLIHPCFQPFVGGDPFNLESPDLASSCDIYECQEKKLLIFQIRSRLFPGKFQAFKELLVQFIKRCLFKHTLLIASSSSEYFSAEQLEGVLVHYLRTSKFSEKEAFSPLGWKEFQFPDNLDSCIVSPVPGSLMAQGLLEDCEKEMLPLLIAICVCSEGNNYPEALRAADSLNVWLLLKQCGELWRMPISWMLPYGSAPPHTLY